MTGLSCRPLDKVYHLLAPVAATDAIAASSAQFALAVAVLAMTRRLALIELAAIFMVTWRNGHCRHRRSQRRGKE